MSFELLSRDELIRQAIIRMQATTPSLTYVGPESAVAAVAEGIAGVAVTLEAYAEEACRRTFLKASYGTFTQELANEAGVPTRTSSRAGVYVVLVPEISAVSAITGAGPVSLTVSGYLGWQTGDSFRLRGASTDEVLTVSSFSGTTLVCALPTYLATYQADITAGHAVRAIFRATVDVDYVVAFQGATFGTLASTTTGDVVPLLSGESSELSLVDKVWCEAFAAGETGMVNRMTATALDPVVRGVNRIFNPLPATGGAVAPTDSMLKYDVAHTAQQATPTEKGREALIKRGLPSVLRARAIETTDLRTTSIAILSKSLAPVSSGDKANLVTFLNEYDVPGVVYSLEDIDLQAIEVEAIVTLAAGPANESAAARKIRLRTAWSRVVGVLAAYLDVSKWVFGTAVSRSALLEIVLADEDISAVNTTAFLPADESTTVGTDALPYLASCVFTDAQTLYTWGDEIAQVYP